MTFYTVHRDNWARTISPNKDVKIFVGAPASSTAAGTGYQDISTLSSIAVKMRQSFPSFGGVMLWDASQAYGELICALKSDLLLKFATTISERKI